MALSVSQANLNPTTDALPVVTGLIALAAITTDGTGVAVNWATSFRNRDGVANLTSKQLRVLIVNNSANANAVRMQLDGIEDGSSNPRYITIPGRSARVFPGFHTGVAITLEQGDTTGGVVTLEAYFDGSRGV